nr:hypothetical protein [Actinomadura sp. K4S16]
MGRIITDAAAAPTGRTKLEVLAAGYAAHAAEAGDIMRIVERVAPSSPAAQEFLDVADRRHIEALEMTTSRRPSSRGSASIGTACSSTTTARRSGGGLP